MFGSTPDIPCYTRFWPIPNCLGPRIKRRSLWNSQAMPFGPSGVSHQPTGTNSNPTRSAAVEAPRRAFTSEQAGDGRRIPSLGDRRNTVEIYVESCWAPGKRSHGAGGVSPWRRSKLNWLQRHRICCGDFQLDSVAWWFPLQHFRVDISGSRYQWHTRTDMIHSLWKTIEKGYSHYKQM